MFMPGMGDLVWTADPGESAFAKTIGYVDQGTNFYVSPVPTPCTIPVFATGRPGSIAS
jgi:hypothetical protein